MAALPEDAPGIFKQAGFAALQGMGTIHGPIPPGYWGYTRGDASLFVRLTRHGSAADGLYKVEIYRWNSTAGWVKQRELKGTLDILETWWVGCLLTGEIE